MSPRDLLAKVEAFDLREEAREALAKIEAEKNGREVSTNVKSSEPPH